MFIERGTETRDAHESKLCENLRNKDLEGNL